jgi:hypothetical protein
VKTGEKKLQRKDLKVLVSDMEILMKLQNEGAGVICSHTDKLLEDIIEQVELQSRGLNANHRNNLLFLSKSQQLLHCQHGFSSAN